MKRFRKLSVCLLAIFSLSTGGDAASLTGTRPNIILVMTDDQGLGDLSCMGHDVLETPHLDKFYEGATRLMDFQVSPTCAPTRSALMSGRFPFMVGVTHTILQRERMAQGVYTFPQALQSAGYTTGLFGKWHLGDDDPYLPQNRGFDEVLMHGAGGIGQVRFGDFEVNVRNRYFDNVLLHNETVVQTEGFCTDVFFESAMAWVKKQHEAGQSHFTYIALNAPHGPLIAPKHYKKRFLDMGYDDRSAGRFGMIENIDDNFGAMMAKLDEWGALENTLVIFMTDNGAANLKGTLNGETVQHYNYDLRGSKNSPHEGGTHVPAFLQWGDKLGRGVDVDGLTAHIDIFPTLCELAGAELPAGMQPLDGRSFVPLLENPEAEWADRKLFFHCGRWPAGKRDAAKFKDCAVRTERWRLVENEMLFDIEADPKETTDVAAEHPEVVKELQAAYLEWWEATEPKLVNEGLPRILAKEQPFAKRYEKQKEEQGIPEWAPADVLELEYQQ
ncbi:MAG: arylsulfatase [Verrucomicrobiota bacterium JB023]|nr:arylsulfatase [Verrucomicrobiota bacterium JB023]